MGTTRDLLATNQVTLWPLTWRDQGGAPVPGEPVVLQAIWTSLRHRSTNQRLEVTRAWGTQTPFRVWSKVWQEPHPIFYSVFFGEVAWETEAKQIKTTARTPSLQTARLSPERKLQRSCWTQSPSLGDCLLFFSLPALGPPQGPSSGAISVLLDYKMVLKPPGMKFQQKFLYAHNHSFSASM